MCIPIDQADILSWLKRQVRVIEAWREDLAMRCDLDMTEVMRIETHYQWLTEEVARLEDQRRAA